MYNVIFVYAVQVSDIALMDVCMFICGNQSPIIQPAGCSLWHNCGFVLFCKATLLQNGHNSWQPVIFHSLFPLFSLRNALHEERKTPQIWRTPHNVLTPQDRHKLTTTRHTNTMPWELRARPTLPQHHRNSSTLTDSFPCIPVIVLPDTLPLLSPQTGTDKSFCSGFYPFISPVIIPEQANPCWCIYLKRMFREKSSTPGHFTTAPSLYRPLSPLSEFWQLFRLLCSSRNPTSVP